MTNHTTLIIALATSFAIQAQASFNPKDWVGLGVTAQLMYVDPKTMDGLGDVEEPTPTLTLVTTKTGPTLFNQLAATMAVQATIATKPAPLWRPTPVAYAGVSPRSILGWQTRWGHGPVVAASMATATSVDSASAKSIATIVSRGALMPLPNGEDRQRQGPVRLPGSVPLPNHHIDDARPDTAATPPKSSTEDGNTSNTPLTSGTPILDARDAAHKSFAEDRHTSATSPVAASNKTQSLDARDAAYKSYAKKLVTNTTATTSPTTHHFDIRKPTPHHGPFTIHPANNDTLVARPACLSRSHPRDLCILHGA